MSDSIEVGGDKLASWIFIDAQLRKLYFVVVDGLIKADNNCVTDAKKNYICVCGQVDWTSCYLLRRHGRGQL